MTHSLNDWLVCYGGLPGIGEEMPVHKDYVYATKQLTTRSMRPIHQMTLDVEHLRLAQAICLARQFCELRQICYTRVDAIYFQPAKCQANATKKASEETTYDKLRKIHFNRPHGVNSTLSRDNCARAIARPKFTA